jgi:predicted RNA-binding Zn ribbon-like protein
MGTVHSLDALGRVLPDPSWPGGREAPPNLEVVRRYLNTMNRENGADRLSTAIAARDWLAADGHVVPMRLSAADLGRLREFRDTLHDALHEERRSNAAERINLIAAHCPVRVRLGPEPSLDPIGSGIDRVIGALVVAVYDALQAGTWKRLKACDHCDWVYFDQSKNASSNWCSSTTCGARQKAAAYRRRQRERDHA